MKKLVLMFVAIAAISFASCTDQKAAAPAPEADTAAVDTVAVDTVEAAADTAAVDTAAVQ
ncbi:MAG: hypothetical protein J5506_10185 [Prevotella sp.]|nr:hypothetical protein [Prevotella sp.]